jgi:hypothetical protein
MANGPGVDTLLSILSEMVEQGGLEHMVVCVRRDDRTMSAVATLNNYNEQDILDLLYTSTEIIEDIIAPEKRTVQ